MKDANYPLFPIFAFVGFVLVLIPLPWHLQAWNAGTSSYILWVSVTCLFMFINSVAWSGTAVNFAPLWCDISKLSVPASSPLAYYLCSTATKIFIGAGVGIPASSLCIVRRLYYITSIKCITITRKDV
jgi:pheromone a factor receptor